MWRWLFSLPLLTILVAACSTSTTTSTKPGDPCPPATPQASTQKGSGARQWSSPPPVSVDPTKSYFARVKSSEGEFGIELMPAEAPIATNNFVFLARQGFYQGVPVHRVLKDFVIQSGDPTGTGMGGPGYTISDEPVNLEYARGVVAMARAPRPNSAGSQFFIALAELGLPKQYVIFGRVACGMDVVDRIGAASVTRGAGGEMSSPVEPIIIEGVTVEER